LEDESLGDNSVEKFDDLELELLVDPTTKFGIPPAYDTQSQALFATLSTAGASVTQESHQVQNTDDPYTPPGTPEAAPGDALGVTITVPTSSVTHPNPVDDASNTSSLTGTTLMALTPTDPTESQTTPTKSIQHPSPRYTGSQHHE
jgi:hypothetical protein